LKPGKSGGRFIPRLAPIGRRLPENAPLARSFTRDGRETRSTIRSSFRRNENPRSGRTAQRIATVVPGLACQAERPRRLHLAQSWSGRHGAAAGPGAAVPSGRPLDADHATIERTPRRALPRPCSAILILDPIANARQLMGRFDLGHCRRRCGHGVATFSADADSAAWRFRSRYAFARSADDFGAGRSPALGLSLFRLALGCSRFNSVRIACRAISLRVWRRLAATRSITSTTLRGNKIVRRSVFIGAIHGAEHAVIRAQTSPQCKPKGVCRIVSKLGRNWFIRRLPNGASAEFNNLTVVAVDETASSSRPA
jgi:hypothetical protein